MGLPIPPTPLRTPTLLLSTKEITLLGLLLQLATCISEEFIKFGDRMEITILIQWKRSANFLKTPPKHQDVTFLMSYRLQSMTAFSWTLP